MKKLLFFNLILFLAFFTISLRASNQVIDLLAESYSPQGFALGNAFYANSRNIYASAYNPASLANISNWSLGLYHTNFFLDLSRSGSFTSFPFFFGALGITGLYETCQVIPRTQEDSNGRPEIIGSFQDQKFVAALTYAQPIFSPNLSFGLNLKGYYQKLYTAWAKGWGYDLGLLLENKPLSLGLTLKNPFKTRFEWSTGAVDYANQTIILGANYQVVSHIGLINLNYDLKYQYPFEDWQYILGLEYCISEILPVRMGIDENKNFCSGVGLKLNNINFDFAYQLHKDLGPIYQIAVVFIN